MRITFILPGFSRRPIGGYRVVYEYANQLVSRGHEVNVIHPFSLSGLRPRPAWKRLLRMPYIWWLSKADQAKRALRGESRLWWQPLDKRVKLMRVPEPTTAYVPRGDAVFATAWFTAEHVLRLPPAKGAKFYLVMDFDPWLGPKDQLEATWRGPFKKVTISRWLYDQVRGCGIPPADVANVPIAIDHRRFQLTGDIEGRPQTVAMLYGFSDYKAPLDGLAALEMVKTRYPNLEVVIFGPFPRPQAVPSGFDYRQDVSEAELVGIYNRAQIFVCSSIAEGFALPPAEAMACGCAVASTDCGGVREYAEHERTALLSPPNDPQALAKNIIRLLEDESLRQRIARQGHECIQNFTWKRSADLLEGFVRGWVSKS